MCQGSFSAIYICTGFSPPTKLVFCFLFRPLASENKQASRPTAAQLDQHSSPSKYAKPAAGHANVARVDMQHLCVVECSYVCQHKYIFLQ